MSAAWAEPDGQIAVVQLTFETRQAGMQAFGFMVEVICSLRIGTNTEIDLFYRTRRKGQQIQVTATDVNNLEVSALRIAVLRGNTLQAFQYPDLFFIRPAQRLVQKNPLQLFVMVVWEMMRSTDLDSRLWFADKLLIGASGNIDYAAILGRNQIGILTGQTSNNRINSDDEALVLICVVRPHERVGWRARQRQYTRVFRPYMALGPAMYSTKYALDRIGAWLLGIRRKIERIIEEFRLRETDGVLGKDFSSGVEGNVFV